MFPCARCGTEVKREGLLCASCAAAEEPIHAPGEVIPPGVEDPKAERPDDTPSRAPIRTALVLAVVADLLQLVMFPLFAEGALSPLNDALDIAMALILSRLIGWHWVFLPSFLGELVPLVDELPCWTLAVLYVRAESSRLESAPD